MQYKRLFRWTDEASKYLEENGFQREHGQSTWIRINANGRCTIAYCVGDAWRIVAESTIERDCEDMYRSGDVSIILLGHEVSDGKTRFTFSADLDGGRIAYSSELRCPVGWAWDRVAKEAIAFMLLADDELRAECGWTFDADEVCASVDSYDDGRETRFNVTVA